MAEKNKPIFKVRSGNIQCSIFRNKIKGKDNKPDFEVDSIVLQRSYKKDDNSEWINETINMRKNDLAKLQVVLNKITEQLFLNKDDKEE